MKIGTLLLLTLTAAGCSPRTQPTLTGDNAEFSYGCHRDGDWFVFDNDHYGTYPKEARSKVSCRYARENWMVTPSPAEQRMQRSMNADRDPKTGLLP